MTIKELIEKLKKFNPNLIVYTGYDGGYGNKIIRLVYEEKDYFDDKPRLYLSEDEEGI